MNKTLNVFISYSLEDEAFKKALDKHAVMLRRNSQKIATWESSQLLAGTDLSKAIQKLQNADLIIILASSDYMANDQLWRDELEQAMQRHHNKTARIVPINIRAFNADDVPFGTIQGLPRQGVVGSSDNDEAWTKIVNELKLVVDELFKDGLGTDTSNNTPASNNTPPANNDTRTIRELIAQGKLQEALALLPGTDDFTLLKSRFNNNERGNRLGTLDHDDYTREKSRITVALLDLLG